MSSCAGVTSNGLELTSTAVAVSSVSDRVCSSDFVSPQRKLSNGICSPRNGGSARPGFTHQVLPVEYTWKIGACEFRQNKCISSAAAAVAEGASPVVS